RPRARSDAAAAEFRRRRAAVPLVTPAGQTCSAGDRSPLCNAPQARIRSHLPKPIRRSLLQRASPPSRACATLGSTERNDRTHGRAWRRPGAGPRFPTILSEIASLPALPALFPLRFRIPFVGVLSYLHNCSLVLYTRLTYSTLAN